MEVKVDLGMLVDVMFQKIRRVIIALLDVIGIIHIAIQAVAANVQGACGALA